MKEYKELCEDAKKNNKEKPLVTNYIGGCFLKIAESPILSTKLY